MATIDTGNQAEQAVASHLERIGYTIIDRNWSTKWCEVDIIARKDEVLWFVEVKYRRTTDFGDGLEYIGPKKLVHMQRAAELWTSRHGYDGEYTLAAVSVTGDYAIGELVEV